MIYDDPRKLIRDVRLLRDALDQQGNAIAPPPELEAARARLTEVSGLYLLECIIRQQQLGSGPILL